MVIRAPVDSKEEKGKLNPHTPVAQKISDEVIFRRFQGESVEFFKIKSH